MKKSYLLLVAFLLCCNMTMAQKEFSYSDKELSYVHKQTGKAYALIDSLLLKYPPQTCNLLERKMAMMAVDLIVHDKVNDNIPQLYEYINRRISHVARKLSEPVKKGVRIFKLYNDSFIAKTASTTIAFDLILGGSPDIEPYISDSLMECIVDQCDILFISHEHGDHANRSVARMFTAKNKIIVAPTGVWEGVSPNIRNLRPDQMTDYTIGLPENRTLKLRIFPGYQSYIVNNINHITTPEGFRIMHIGDQYGKEHLEWLSHIKDSTQTDVLLANCWVTAPEVTIPGIAPKLVIPGHENELWHTITHREPHWLTWDRMEGIDVPFVFMTWGEYYDYIPQ